MEGGIPWTTTSSVPRSKSTSVFPRRPPPAKQLEPVSSLIVSQLLLTCWVAPSTTTNACARNPKAGQKQLRITPARPYLSFSSWYPRKASEIWFFAFSASMAFSSRPVAASVNFTKLKKKMGGKGDNGGGKRRKLWSKRRRRGQNNPSTSERCQAKRVREDWIG